MADYMDPENYKNMIEALDNFASKTKKTCEELESACTRCITVLGDDDVASPKIITSAQLICTHYESLISKAQALSADMADELTRHYVREQQGPGGPGGPGGFDDDEDDDF